MSVLLRDRVWTMLSEVAKRGVYPLHGYKLGIYRIPLEISQKYKVSSMILEALALRWTLTLTGSM
jgi:hypothetical protein